VASAPVSWAARVAPKVPPGLVPARVPAGTRALVPSHRRAARESSAVAVPVARDASVARAVPVAQVAGVAFWAGTAAAGEAVARRMGRHTAAVVLARHAGAGSSGSAGTPLAHPRAAGTPVGAPRGSAVAASSLRASHRPGAGASASSAAVAGHSRRASSSLRAAPRRRGAGPAAGCAGTPPGPVPGAVPPAGVTALGFRRGPRCRRGGARACAARCAGSLPRAAGPGGPGERSGCVSRRGPGWRLSC
jgi:hypothetical protein